MEDKNIENLKKKYFRFFNITEILEKFRKSKCIKNKFWEEKLKRNFKIYKMLGEFF